MSDYPNSSQFPTSELDYIKYKQNQSFDRSSIVYGYGGNFHLQESKIVVNSKRLPQIIYVLECPTCPGPGPVQLNHIYKVNNNEWNAPWEPDIQHHIEGALNIPSISMDIDSNDDVHILFSHILYDTQNLGNESKIIAKIMYGHWDHYTGTWELSETDSWKGDSTTDFRTSISIDSQNRPHIAYVLPQDESGNTHKLIYGVLAENYSISGSVIDKDGNGIGGVTISFGGSTPDVVTSPSGYFVQYGFKPGSYSVTPSKLGYTFSPKTMHVSIGSKDIITKPFSGKMNKYSISGSVLDEKGKGLPKVLIKADSGIQITTSFNGKYKLNGFTLGTYKITPLKDGYDFIPSSLDVNINGSGNITNQNFKGILR